METQDKSARNLPNSTIDSDVFVILVYSAVGAVDGRASASHISSG